MTPGWSEGLIIHKFGDSIENISCLTKDGVKDVVTLEHRKNQDSIWKPAPAYSDGVSRVVSDGQKFTIKNLKRSDEGFYRCHIQRYGTTYQLLLGFLMLGRTI